MFSNLRNLADIDDDGRLVLEEFQLAMHFVGVAKSGKPVPSSLPPEFIPPSYQKAAISSASTAGRAVSGPKGSTGTTAIPSIQPPAGGARKASEGVTAFAAAPVAVSQTTAPVVLSAPKPSVDLLLLDDPFGAPPAELPVPLLEQGSASKATADEQKLTEGGATPPETEFSCSVVWNTEAEIPADETSNELEPENPESEDLKHEVETESSDVVLVPDVAGIVEEEERLVDDEDAIDNVKPMSVPELHITTVEDAPTSGRLI